VPFGFRQVPCIFFHLPLGCSSFFFMSKPYQSINFPYQHLNTIGLFKELALLMEWPIKTKNGHFCNCMAMQQKGVLTWCAEHTGSVQSTSLVGGLGTLFCRKLPQYETTFNSLSLNFIARYISQLLICYACTKFVYNELVYCIVFFGTC